MNGMTSATGYYFRPNRCKCGHDYVEHSIPSPPTTTITASLCRQCIFTAGSGTQNRHYFASKYETYPPNALSFMQSRPYAYYCVGVANSGFTVMSTNAANIGAGTNVIPVASVAGIHIGDSVTVLGTNPGNTAIYTVIGVDPVGLDITIWQPVVTGYNNGLFFNMGPLNPLWIAGVAGDTAGPGLTANNQRAG